MDILNFLSLFLFLFSQSLEFKSSYGFTAYILFSAIAIRLFQQNSPFSTHHHAQRLYFKYLSASINL